MSEYIDYPYLPEGRNIVQVSADDPFMREAQRFAMAHRGEIRHIHAGVLVKDGVVIGRGSIGQGVHAEKGCERQRLKVPTGTGYDLCAGCSVDNHSEPNAIRDALANGHEIEGADFYLWGHWWCCEPCWDKLIVAGVRNTYTRVDSERLFEKSHPDNVLGRQETVA